MRLAGGSLLGSSTALGAKYRGQLYHPAPMIKPPPYGPQKFQTHKTTGVILQGGGGTYVAGKMLPVMLYGPHTGLGAIVGGDRLSHVCRVLGTVVQRLPTQPCCGLRHMG